MTRRPAPRDDSGMPLLVAAEGLAAAVGFAVLLRTASALGPGGFAGVESASALAGVALVWVRGGVESIAWREAARRPRIARPLAEGLALAKLALAAAGMAVVGILALIAGPGRGPLFLASGLILLPSALTMDLGTRAFGRLRLVAAVQAVRALALGAACWWLVRRPGDTTAAAGLAAMSEGLAAAIYAGLHVRDFGAVRPRVRPRAAAALMRRGLVASLSRSGRVALYAVDLLILAALCPDAAVGPYAAARRVVFALVGLALVVPAAVAPAIARDWVAGADVARSRFARETARLLGPALAASIGLMLTARGWMAALFGPGYEGGAAALVALAARFPLVLLAAMTSAALVAVRRESGAWRVTAAACLAAALVVPMAALRFGPLGAGGAMIAVEGMAAIGGWHALRRLGAAPAWPTILGPDLAGCMAMIAAVVLVGDRPVWLATMAGGLAYGAVRLWPGCRASVRVGMSAKGSRRGLGRRDPAPLPAEAAS